ncbi:unnamed protein product, partial [marine sediment metagenome]
MQKKVFKVTDSISSKFLPSYVETPGVQLPPIQAPVNPNVVADIQDQVDDITDSIENKYCANYVFDQWQEITTSAP